jgi:H+/Cl- antiporter ClcA
MFNFISAVITFWFSIAVLALTLLAFKVFILTPVCDFVANSPFIKYIILPFLVIMAILSAVLMYYRRYPEKPLPRWLEKDCAKKTDLRKLLNR